ncbi:MAG: HlyD family efflux transporter periplasmic adaptor subunit [Candidatus Peregrinibacteria bacterium]
MYKPSLPLLIFSLFFFSACGSTEVATPDATPIPTVPVTEAKFEKFVPTVEVSGTLTPSEEFTVASEVSGTIGNVLVEEGETVNAGDVLMILEPENSLIRVSYESAMVGLENAKKSLAFTERITEEEQKNALVGIEQSKIAIAQARISWDSAKKANTFTQRSSNSQTEIAQKTLEISQKELEIAKSNAGQLVQNEAKTKRNLLEDSGNALSPAMINFRQALTVADEILGVSSENAHLNDGYEDYISRKSPQDFYKAKNEWSPLSTAVDELEQRFVVFSQIPYGDADEKEMVAILDDIANNAKSIRSLLREIESILKGAVTGGSFTDANLAALKTKITVAQNALDANITALTNARQSLSDFAIQSPQRITNSNSQIALLESRVLSAKQALEHTKDAGDLQGVSTSTQKEVSQKTLDTSRKALESSQNNLSLLKARDNLSVQSAQAQYDSAKAMLDTALLNLSKLTVRATNGGTITHVFAHEGNTLSPGTPLFSLGEFGSLKLTGDISVAERAMIRIGDPVVLTVEGQEKPVNGKVSNILPTADATTHRIPIEITLENGTDIPANIFAKATISLPSDTALFIPLKSLVSQNPAQVLVAAPGEEKDGKYLAETREVKLGRIFGEKVEVVEGIAEGELVIAEKTLLVSVGAAVMPVFPDKVSEEPQASVSPESSNAPSPIPSFPSAGSDPSLGIPSVPAPTQAAPPAPIPALGTLPSGHNPMPVSGVPGSGLSDVSLEKQDLFCMEHPYSTAANLLFAKGEIF